MCKIVFKTILVACITGVCLHPIDSAIAQSCAEPGQASPLRGWVWSPVNIVYQSSLPLNALNQAVSGWNSQQNHIQFSTQFFGARDVWVYDSDLEGDGTGLVIRYNQFYSTCFQKRDTCGKCMNVYVMYTSEMLLDAGYLGQLVQTPGWNWDLTTTAKALIAHELGHVWGLTEISDFGVCSQTSIMTQSLGRQMLCNISGPLSCDIAGLLNFYQSFIPPWCPCANPPISCTF